MGFSLCGVTAAHTKDHGFCSCHPHNSQDRWLSPVTLLLGDKDIGMELVTQVSINWLGLKRLVAALAPEAEWIGSMRSHCMVLTSWIWARHALNWKAPNAKSYYQIQCWPGRYEGSQSVIYPACHKWRHSSYKYAQNSQIYMLYKKWPEEKGKWLVKKPVYYKKYTVHRFSFSLIAINCRYGNRLWH